MTKRFKPKGAKVALAAAPEQSPAQAQAEQREKRKPNIGQLMLPTDAERYSRATSFGAASIDRIAAVLKNASDGRDQRELQDLFDWMRETDPHTDSVCETRLVALATLPWTVTPAKTSNADDPMASLASDFVSRAILGIRGFQTALHDLADAIHRGFAVEEINWERRDGAWVPGSLSWIHARRFVVGKDDIVRAYENGTKGAYGEELEPNKFIVHIPKQRSGYAARTGTLRVVAWPWIFKRWLQKYALSGAERFGLPTPFAHVAENAPDDVVEDIVQALQNLTQGQAGYARGETKVEFLAGVLGDSKIYNDLLAFFNAEISKAVLGSTLNVEGGANGNRAAAESQAATTIDPRKAYDAAALEDTINRDLVAPLIAFNTDLFGGTMPPLPKFSFVLDNAKTNPIYAYHFQGGIITKNEVRLSLGLPAWTREDGGEERLDIGAAPAPSPSPWQNSSRSAGGQDAESPLASRAMSRAQSFPTSETSERFRMTPLGLALSKQSGGRQS